MMTIYMLAAASFAFAPSAAACGGNHPAAIEADSGQGVGYCSDGTISGVRDLLSPTGDGASSCAGEYPATLETENLMLADGVGVAYCSDGTLSEAGVPATGAGTSCGGSHAAALSADTGAGVSYCSDGTIGGVSDAMAPTGSGASSCGGAYPASVETETVYVQEGIGVAYCSDGTLQALGL